MFTGIIEETGRITRIDLAANGIKLVIEAQVVLENVKLGDSISVNGACQTVVWFDSKTFAVEVSSETLDVTTFKDYKPGKMVNLERALKLNDRLGGHIVSGHVDSEGELIDIKPDGLSKVYSFKAPPEISKYLIHKGSICIDGVSLTVYNLRENDSVFSVAVIPHTFDNTTLLLLKCGDKVNLESDIIGKYIEKLLKSSNNQTSKKSNISYDFLSQHGFV